MTKYLKMALFDRELKDFIEEKEYKTVELNRLYFRDSPDNDRIKKVEEKKLKKDKTKEDIEDIKKFEKNEEKENKQIKENYNYAYYMYKVKQIYYIDHDDDSYSAIRLNEKHNNLCEQYLKTQGFDINILKQCNYFYKPITLINKNNFK